MGSIFLSGLAGPSGLGFDSSSNLYVITTSLLKYDQGLNQSTFATGVTGTFLTIQPVPEPATWSLLALGAVALLGSLRLRRRSS